MLLIVRNHGCTPLGQNSCVLVFVWLCVRVCPIVSVCLSVCLLVCLSVRVSLRVRLCLPVFYVTGSLDALRTYVVIARFSRSHYCEEYHVSPTSRERLGGLTDTRPRTPTAAGRPLRFLPLLSISRLSLSYTPLLRRRMCFLMRQFPVFIGLYRAIIEFGNNAIANESFLWLPSLQVGSWARDFSVRLCM